MEDEEAPATPSVPDHKPPEKPKSSTTVEEATPTDKGVLETQESVPQPLTGKKAVPSRRPPRAPRQYPCSQARPPCLENPAVAASFGPSSLPAAYGPVALQAKEDDAREKHGEEAGAA